MNRDTILKIANLCKLRLSDDEIDMYLGQFQKILDYMDQLSEVDTDGIEPYMTPVTGNLRADMIDLKHMVDKRSALGAAYNHDDNYFIVPKVIGV